MDNQQPSTFKMVKVQRLFRKEVHLSEWKRRTPYIKGGDIVCSYVKA